MGLGRTELRKGGGREPNSSSCFSQDGAKHIDLKGERWGWERERGKKESVRDCWLARGSGREGGRGVMHTHGQD